MDSTEKERILRGLQAGHTALRASTSGVDDETARWKPPSGSWSILECVEHLVETERYLLTRLQAAVPMDKPFEKSRREEKIARLAADRTRRIEARKKPIRRGNSTL
jgi:hypothetical protein